MSILVSYLASVAVPLKLLGIFVKDADIFRDDTANATHSYLEESTDIKVPVTK